MTDLFHSTCIEHLIGHPSQFEPLGQEHIHPIVATLAENQPIIVYQFRDLLVWCFQSEEEVRVAGVWWTCMVPVTWYLAFPCCAPCFRLTPLPTPTHLLNVNPDLPSL